MTITETAAEWVARLVAEANTTNKPIVSAAAMLDGIILVRVPPKPGTADILTFSYDQVEFLVNGMDDYLENAPPEMNTFGVKSPDGSFDLQIAREGVPTVRSALAQALGKGTQAGFGDTLKLH